VAAAVQEGVHVVGLSVLSGSHREVVPAVVDGLRAAGVDDVPVVVGGFIPPDDAAALRARGVAAVFTPKDYRLTEMMNEIVTLIRSAQGLAPTA
jgi:(2R)-ethylmalonyl-CoA mutase